MALPVQVSRTYTAPRLHWPQMPWFFGHLVFEKPVVAHVQMHKTDRVLENSFKLQSVFCRNNDFTEKEEQNPEASLPEAVPPPMHRLSSGKPASFYLLSWSELS